MAGNEVAPPCDPLGSMVMDPRGFNTTHFSYLANRGLTTIMFQPIPLGCSDGGAKPAHLRPEDFLGVVSSSDIRIRASMVKLLIP